MCNAVHLLPCVTGIKREADEDLSPSMGNVKVPRVDGDVAESVVADIVETISEQSRMLGPDVSLAYIYFRKYFFTGGFIVRIVIEKSH